jgi:hypothetical protein
MAADAATEIEGAARTARPRSGSSATTAGCASTQPARPASVPQRFSQESIAEPVACIAIS